MEVSVSFDRVLPPALPDDPESPPTDLFWLKLLGMALLILGARWWLLHLYGSPVPGLDEWDGEAGRLFIPWLNHTLSWRDFLTAHNEHRILPSSLLSFLVFWLNGAWDPLAETAASAAVYTGAAVALAAIARQCLGAARENAIIAIVSFLWAVPYATNNALKAIHSAWYFLFLFSLIAIWGLLLCRPLKAGWWIGLASLAFATLSLASGFLVGTVIALISLWGAWHDWRQRRMWLWRAFIGIGVTIIGILLVEPVARHAGMQARTVWVFLQSAEAAAAFPQVFFPGASLLMYLPFLALLASILLKRPRQYEKLTASEMLVLALGGWCLLQIACIAYGRGNNSGPPANRYFDTLMVGVVANFLAIPVLAQRWTGQSKRLRILGAGAFVWGLLMMSGLATLAIRHALPVAQYESERIVRHLTYCRQYLASDGEQALPSVRNLAVLPFTDAKRLGDLLLGMRGYMSADIEPGVELGGKDAMSNGFSLNAPWEILGEKEVWHSRTPDGLSYQGMFRSRMITIDKPYLQIPVFGNYGKSEAQTLMLEIDRGKRYIPVPIPLRPKVNQASVRLRNPGVPFRLVARSASAADWFGFAAPRGLGWLAYWARWGMQYSLVWMMSGVALLAFANGRDLLKMWCGHAEPQN